MTTNNPTDKHIHSETKIAGTALVVNAREIFFDPKVHSLCEKMLNVTNAEEALKMFSPSPSKYSLIICNYELHDKLGITLLEQLRAIPSSNFPSTNFMIPFIMLIPTNTYEELIKVIAWANELGVNDIISTPFSMDKIISKMKSFVEFHHNTIKHREILDSAATAILKGITKEANALLESYKSLSPNKHYDHYAPFLKGKFFEKHGDIQKAEQYYRKSIDLAGASHFALGMNALIDIMVKTNHFAEAIKEAENAFNNSPLNPHWKLHIARIALLQNDFDKANKIYSFLVEQNPKYQIYINKMLERFKVEYKFDENQMSNLTDEQKAKMKELSEKASSYIENSMYDHAIRTYLSMMKIDEMNPKKYTLILATLNYKWYKSLDSLGVKKDNYKTLVSAIDYTLELLRINATDEKALKLMIRIVQTEKSLLNKVLEPRISNEIISYVKDSIQV